ncbi:protein TonB [Rhizobium sp. PP-F2F-G48]|uniref:energy transducer TonB n=1 Tax=Rhizobium sp. PP-F2F-G48 TaxID=2135651 RepID=UPI00104A0ED3|nr:energy transducer TonB [Rhizobium sp. PP-F2F-G48]TCM58350.1 protein TonB [Rhizobium sp. PP-F2F-G48]
MQKAVKWAMALSFSVAAHAGAAIAFLPDAPPPPLAATQGGEEMEIALLGNAFEETVESGAISDTITPVETPPEEVATTKPETTEVETETLTATTPAETVSEVLPDTVPTDADVILPADALPPVATDAPEVVAALPPVATVIPETRPETPPDVADTPPLRKATPVKPVTKKAEVEKPKKKPEPIKSGQQGQAETRNTKGRSDGSEIASASSSGKGTRARSAGNASFSNFEGKVRSALQRAVRYPSRAESKGVKGVVQVQFLVAANGSVSGPKVTRSSGSPVLDSAALDAARRMRSPKIPEDSGRSSWLFTIPITFTR